MKVPTVSAAPLVDITTRHFRYLLRLVSKRTVLYTPMLPARKVASLKNGTNNRSRGSSSNNNSSSSSGAASSAPSSSLLRFHPSEAALFSSPVQALPCGQKKARAAANQLRESGGGGGVVAQLGGESVREVLRAARKVQEAGFAEVNLNLGCPARGAQGGSYGATLMLPQHHRRVVDILKAMTSELSIPVSCKVRIGVDDHDSYEFFRDFAEMLHVDGGVDKLVVHARKALLAGLPVDAVAPGLRGRKGRASPRDGQESVHFVTTRQNRLHDLVPIRHDFVYRLKRDFPHLRVEINGEIRSVEDILDHFRNGVDGCMLGRAARDNPFFFASVDSEVFGDSNTLGDIQSFEVRCEILEKYAEYCRSEQAGGFERSREMLIKPMNQWFDGFTKEKRVFGHALRSTPKTKRPALLADEIHEALSMARKAHSGKSLAARPFSRRQKPAQSQKVQRGDSSRKSGRQPPRSRGKSAQASGGRRKQSLRRATR